MRNINVEDPISKLGINDEVVDLLNQNNINTIDELWKLKRKDLKELSFTSDQINHIIIKMQLKGMDLNHKKY